jgi:hypothetical protein
MPSIPSCRVSLLACALALGAVVLPAHADPEDPAPAYAPICPQGSSQVIFDRGPNRNTRTRILRHEASPTETDVCFQTLEAVETVVAMTHEVDAGPPVMSTPEPGDCTLTVVDTRAPVNLWLALGVDTQTGTSVCFGVEGDVTMVTFPATLPNLAVWLPANSFLNRYGYCSQTYAIYEVNELRKRDAGQQAWRDCYQQDNQVI